jgi:hypothetical protein
MPTTTARRIHCKSHYQYIFLGCNPPMRFRHRQLPLPGYRSPRAPILCQCLAFPIGLYIPFPEVVQPLCLWSTLWSGPFHCSLHHHQSQLTCISPHHMAEIYCSFKCATLTIISRFSFSSRKIDSSVVCSFHKMPRILLHHHISKDLMRLVSLILRVKLFALWRNTDLISAYMKRTFSRHLKSL